MTIPNIYNFATSELSQDATLAYLLSWAKPEYRDDYPTLNRLGEKLLRALVRSSAEVQGKNIKTLDHSAINKLEVERGHQKMDIRARINNEVFLIIEDKTNTDEHSCQTERYTRAARDYPKNDGTGWTVMPVYLKTGNEPAGRRPQELSCGVFLRKDLLDVLAEVPETGNTIVEEFRHHLRNLQERTESFLTTPYSQWSFEAQQGYYLALGKWLTEQDQLPNGQPRRDADWDKVNNRAGGFLGFWWHFCPCSAHRCRLYLQIENGVRLQIRISDAQDASGAHMKAHCALQWAVLRDVAAVAEASFAQIRMRKSGTFKGGWWAGVADIFFEEGRDTYLALDAKGLIDLHATEQRLLQVMALVDSSCKKAGETTA